MRDEVNQLLGLEGFDRSLSSRMRVVAGVDAHADEHDVAVLDGQGRLLGTAAFATTADGYQQLTAWVRTYGHLRSRSRPSTRRRGTRCG